MKKIVEIEIAPLPEEIAREVAETNMYWQVSFIYNLAKICYNHPNLFYMRINDIAEDIKYNYGHDARIMIKRMVSEVNNYLGEDDNAKEAVEIVRDLCIKEESCIDAIPMEQIDKMIEEIDNYETGGDAWELAVKDDILKIINKYCKEKNERANNI